MARVIERITIDKWEVCVNFNKESPSDFEFAFEGQVPTQEDLIQAAKDAFWAKYKPSISIAVVRK